MTIMIKKNLVSPAKYNIKCPNYMEAEFITFHNTYNDATAQAEVNYMIGNNSSTSFHYAVDDKEVVQGIPENRNAWACGDGSRGNGNRKSISVEVCYSKSGGTRYREAEALAIKFIAQLLHERNWSVDRVKEHHHWSGKNCPHCIRNEGRWGEVVSAIKKELTTLKGGKVTTVKPAPVTVKGYLDKGDKSVAVENLQKLLNKAGTNPKLIEDGYFGQATENAVREVQKDNKLVVDGIAGQATMQVLEALTKPKPAVKPAKKPTPSPVNPKVETIKSIQTKLNKLYKANLTVDGVYGSATKKALIKGLQTELNKQANAKLKVDGVWGNATKSKCLTIDNGDKGNITYILQAALFCLGYDPNGLDSIFGNGTLSATKKFQKAKGLTQDGQAGKNTWEKLLK